MAHSSKQTLSRVDPPSARTLADVQALLEHDNHDNRRRLRAFLKNPLFLPRFNVPLSYERDIALTRLKEIASNKFISVFDFERNPLNIFAVHEVCGMVDGSMSTKLTVQWNLFGGTLLRLGSDKHRALLSGVDSLDVMGCFALTELGYGNNAVEMETTATYIPETQEIEVNTPTTLAQKVWITNGAVHAKWAIVFAQLLINERREGVHAVLVRIRNDDMTVRPGVVVRDMGHKHGCNGVDNAVLAFNKVRTPASMLLDRYSKITPGLPSNNNVASLKSTLPPGRARFLKVADQLLSGRLCIASMSLGGCKALLLTAFRYSHARLAAGPSGKSDTSILSFQLQQNALVPLLASTIGLNFGLNHCKNLYAEAATSIPANSKALSADQQTQVLVHVCVIKPLVTWHFERVASICRERCGGQGYLSCNMFGPGIGFAHAGISAEGDNAVLLQKVAKEILAMAARGNTKFGQPQLSQFKGCIGDLATRCLSLLYAREQKSKNQLGQLMLQAAASVKDSSAQGEKKRSAKVAHAQYRVWMEEHAELVQTVARAFGDRMCVEQFARAVSCNSTAQKDSKGGPKLSAESLSLLRCALDVFAAHVVLTGLRSFLVLGVLDQREAAAIDAQYTAKIKEMSAFAMTLAHSLGVEEDMLSAPAARDWAAYNTFDNKGEVLKSSL